MKKYLIRLADHLDKKGLYKEASYLDKIIKLSDEQFGIEFDEPTIRDVSKPIGVPENLFELSWGTVFDIMLDDYGNVSSLKVELPSGKIVTYTTMYRNGEPLANTIKDLNAKYNLGLNGREPVPPKSREEIIKDFQNTIVKSEDMSEPESEKAFNYFYINYPQYEKDFVGLIKKYKTEKSIAKRQGEELAKIEEYKKSPQFKKDRMRAVSHLTDAINKAKEGNVAGAKEKVDLILSVYPHHKDELNRAMSVLGDRSEVLAVKDMFSQPTYTSIETEEFVPVGPGLPSSNLDKFLP